VTLDGVQDPMFRGEMAALFEHAPRFIGRLVAARPFGSWDALFAAAERIAREMPEDEQLELINAHPRLGAPPATVSQHSFREQGYDRDTVEAMADLELLNAAYEARHGFRFCVFVDGRSRPELVPVLEAAIGADRDDEIRRALHDVVAIARDRATKTATLA
jgi:2-oxo-4-hydroxy-4-carboxy--5-ureidoimidazoline (OHCU) decarboxylase